MKKLKYSYTRERMFPGFDGKVCKMVPQIIYDGKDTALLNYGMLLLTSCDVPVGGYIARSTDGGKSFGEPKPFEGVETYEDGIRISKGGGWGIYNKYHDKWLMLGKSGSFENDKQPMLVDGISLGDPYLSILDPVKCELEAEPTQIPFPFEYLSARPFFQPYEYENGDMLLTFSYATRTHHKPKVVTIRYALEGNRLRIVEVGEPIAGEQYARGLEEPSLARLGDKYYLALRTDEVGLFAVSKDGYHFEEPKPWVWEDGSVLENYNTQQRWIRHKDGLFLVYTRKGAHNDHVFRHRAPLFMTRFDEDRQCLIRSEEVILVPELGARLGNFAVTDVSEKEFWVVTAEWMQPIGCEKYGSDNSIWRARVLFEE